MTAAPPGWYPDRADPAVFRWYDGTTWTEHTQPRRPLPPGADANQRRGSSWYVLASAVRVTLGLLALVLLVNAVSSFWARQVLGSWLTDPRTITAQQGALIDDLARWCARAEGLLVLATAGLFISWFYGAHGRGLNSRYELETRRGWTIGGWFVPLVSFVMPYKCMRELDRASQKRPARGSRLIAVWWVCFVLWEILNRVTSITYNSSASAQGFHDITSSLRTAKTEAAAGSLLGMVAAGLAVAVVAQITQRVRATEDAETGHLGPV